MLAISVSAYSEPAGYQASEVPKPTITKPRDVLIQVHAASINPIDVKKAGGDLKLALKEHFPYIIGYDCAGTIVEVGASVTTLHVGDEVYTRLPEASRGAWAQYAVCSEEFVAPKPRSLSFEDAASIPLAALTALQALRKYNGSLVGKTVFIPAGLSGTGAYACQLAKNVFQAGKVITTVSTTKIEKVATLLGEKVVDQIIDYTKTDPKTAIPAGSVDFFFDTTSQTMAYLSLMTPKTSSIISISTQPSGDVLQNSPMMCRPDNPTLPGFVRLLLNTTDAYRKMRTRRSGIHYEYFFVESNAQDLKELSEYIESGKLKPVVGQRVKIGDIDEVRKACALTRSGKGGIGKTVINIIE